VTAPSEFAIAIPTIGRSDALKAALESVTSLVPPPGRILVIDGDPEGAARSVAEAFGGRVEHMTAAKGLTKQRNAGLRKLTEAVVVFLDDDVDISPNVLASLGPVFDDPAIVGATGRVVEESGGRLAGKQSRVRKMLFGGGTEGGFTRFGYPRRLIDLGTAQDISFMQGCFMAVRRSSALEVGFDENLPGYGLAEDEDFSYRLSRAGRIRYVPEAVVHHKNLGFLTTDQRAFGRQVVVNRTYLFRKNFKRTPLARIQFALFVLVLIGHRLLNREWQGARGIVEGAWTAWRRKT
jgi:GT2 family glycosyltransferase